MGTAAHNLLFTPNRVNAIVTRIVPICIYCGLKAGWFADHHDACIAQYQSAMSAVSQGVAKAIQQHNPDTLAQLKNTLNSVHRPASVSFSDLCVAALNAWKAAVDELCYTTRTDFGLAPEQITFLIHFLQTVFSWLDPLPPNFQELIDRYHEEIMSLQIGDTIRRICSGESIDRLATGDPTVDSN